MGSHTFKAHSPGRCAPCNQWIYVGDEITHDDRGEIVHVECDF